MLPKSLAYRLKGRSLDEIGELLLLGHANPGEDYVEERTESGRMGSFNCGYAAL